MDRTTFCAYGAVQTVATLEQLERVDHGEAGEPFSSLAHVEPLRDAAVRLQACLTLFAPCFPPTRIAFWKRRLRRLIRALNALRDHLRLMQIVHTSHRLHLRLQQRAATLQATAQRAWERLHKEHIPNEIRGLAKRYGQSPRPADEQGKAYALARWHELARINLKNLPLPPELEREPLDVLWGRVQLMVAVAELLEPLLSETSTLVQEAPLAHHSGSPCLEGEAIGGQDHPLSNEGGKVVVYSPRLSELKALFQWLDAVRFRTRAVALLEQLKADERALTLHYQGHLRGFKRIEQEFDRWIEQIGADEGIDTGAVPTGERGDDPADLRPTL
jgi:hypothetical protein